MSATVELDRWADDGGPVPVDPPASRVPAIPASRVTGVYLSKPRTPRQPQRWVAVIMAGSMARHEELPFMAHEATRDEAMAFAEEHRDVRGLAYRSFA